MSKSLNIWHGSGYLAADPKTHTFDDGSTVANLRLAVNNQVKDKDTGEWVDDALFLAVKVYGKAAAACEQWLRKGSFVIVSGRLGKPRHWQDEGSGEHRVTMVIDRAEVVFGPRTQVEGSTMYQTSSSSSSPASSSSQLPPADDLGDDDIPF